MYKVLIADDVRLSLHAEKDYLEGRNVKVYTSASGREALELTGLIQPDLVVLDFEMPDLDGSQVCESIRRDPRTSHIPVMILTMREDPDLPGICRRAGCISFLKKDEGSERLLQEVARILGVPRRQDVRVPCEFTAGIAQRGAAFSGYVENISDTGMFLTAARGFEAGMALRLHFELPGTDEGIRVLGEVVRAQEITASRWGIGIQFLEMDAASRTSLRAFLDRCL